MYISSVPEGGLTAVGAAVAVVFVEKMALDEEIAATGVAGTAAVGSRLVRPSDGVTYKRTRGRTTAADLLVEKVIVIGVHVEMSLRDGMGTFNAGHRARAFAGVGRAVVDALPVGVGNGIADATGAIGAAEPMVPIVGADYVGMPLQGVQIAATVIAGIAVGGKIV